MKKNFVIPLVISIVLGFISAQIVYSTYRKNLENTDYNVYLIQAGSYNNKDDLEKDFSLDDEYIILEEDGVYNVYVGMTTDLINANKIKNLYSNKNYDTYIKPTVVNNIEFVSNLEQYDILMSEVDDEENIISINDVILSSYEEMVLGKQFNKGNNLLGGVIENSRYS